MKILFLTDNFPPETNAPASRTFEHAREWVAAGNQVTVITCFPNFPAGKVYSGFKNHWYRVEELEGIRVVRVKTYITANEGFVKRTLDYLSFMFTGTIAACFQKSPDVIVATSPQFFCALAGYLTSRLKRKPWVFELRDIWPASITAVGAMKKNRIIHILEKLELFLYDRADLIVSVTASFRRELIERGVQPDKISVVTNGVDLTRYKVIPKDENLLTDYGLENKFVIGYIGTHGMAHALDKVIEAAELLHAEDLSVTFLFVGSGAQKNNLEKLVKSRNLTNVRIIGQQPKSKMPQLWSICDVALIPLKNSPVFSDVIPSKLFECMGMGLPVIISIPEGEATDIVKETGCGIVVPPEDPDALAYAIKGLYGDEEKLSKLRKNASASALQYSRPTLAHKMLTSLETLNDTNTDIN